MSKHQDIGRVTLNVLFIGGLLAASFWIMKPFLPAILWATTLVLATWPLMRWVQRRTGGRRSVAVVIMTLAILLVLILPVWVAISTVATNIDAIRDLIHTALTMRIPGPPAWVTQMPMVGKPLADAWTRFSLAGGQEFVSKVIPYAGAITQWFAYAIGSLGGMFVQFLLTTAIAAAMFSGGEYAAHYLIRFGHRLAGERGERAVHIAGQAIKSVALGVVVTAVAQAAIGGIGLMLVGLPLAGVLTALMFLLCLIQLGPAIVLIPAVVWVYYSGDTAWGTVLLVFSLVAMTIDQIIRPILIRRGAALPMLLILAGVIGGLIAFGFLGIFIGPTVLAVTYALLNAWVAEDRRIEPEDGEVPVTRQAARG